MTKPPSPDQFAEWLCRQGDNCVVLGQRLSAWCGHGPALEEDIALANVALDLFGQGKLWLELAGEVEGRGRDADALAFLRDAHAFRNLLLVELPDDDYATTLTRQFLFDAWHLPWLDALSRGSHPRVAAIAAKARKEAAYHVERSADLVIRLGDGSAESHARLQRALEALWPFTGEIFAADAVDEAIAAAGIAPTLAEMRPAWESTVTEVLTEAVLRIPGDVWQQGVGRAGGGRQGRHSEHLGYLLAEMQFLRRAYPDARW